MDLYNDDCLNVLKNIPTNSIDLVVTDPPYNIKKAKWDTWKTVQDYIEFLGSVFLELQRVLKETGSLYYFHNDFMQVVELQNFINQNTRFIFNSFIIWNKENFRALSWKNPSENNNLRSWFNTCEYALYYTFQEGAGFDEVLKKATYPIREYIKDEIIKARGKLNLKEINKALGIASTGGGMASHYFTTTKQSAIPTEEHYIKLQKWLGDKFLKRSYDDLKIEFEKLKIKHEELRYIHNLDEEHNNVWTSEFKNNGRYHACEKPLDIIRRIIKTSSNIGDTVLDCFMGSGTTGVACEHLGRKFIGIEIDKNYFNTAKKRIENIDYVNLTLF